MTKIKIDKEKCIKCGACIKDCITYSLIKDEEGFAKVATDGDTRCISCQHCFAICPVGAISGKVKEAHVIDNSKCIKCGACMEKCKFGAIIKA